MSEMNRIVAHYLDGRLVKGITEDFAPNRIQFHMHPVGSESRVPIDCQKLKAVFFVRDLSGDPGREDRYGFGHVATESEKGKKIAIQFKDGEVMFGYTLAYTDDREGFFVAPADPNSNNIRIYVIRNATQKVMVGAEAETFAKNSGQQAA